VTPSAASGPVVALVGDLMDRSRISAALPAVAFASTPTAAAERGPSVVVIDLARHGGAVAALRAALPHARIVAYGPHVDGDAADAAWRDGADDVLPRSRFFRRIAESITGAGAADDPAPDPADRSEEPPAAPGHPPP
jgi:hypothetical protein